MDSDSEIVISGISGRFPESSNIEEFKQNLINGVDMVIDDDRRWPRNTYGLPKFGKLKDLSSFDASFFGVSPKLAHYIDPQLRMLLETTHEALIDAAINPSTIRGSRVGVFVGISSLDALDSWLQRNPDDINGYELIGCSMSMIANRISFAFDFNGPSYMMDTACAASFSALHVAASAIRAGECDAAIVGGVNLVLKPKHTLSLMKTGPLNSDGNCKSFDIAADGYTRAEAVVALYLQKATDARRIYATVVHTKTNTDGYKLQGITYPSSQMQNKLLREIYDEANINPADIIYLEAHGTGTAVGDPEEINSVDDLFCKNRATPLLIGSVKSNMGHAEAASGLCSISKVLIAMETGVIPGNLHFYNPNPKIPALSEGRIQVVDKTTPWNSGLAAINSFGFGGANVHVILRSNPKTKLFTSLDHVDALPKLITVSGCTEEAVHVLMNEASDHRQDDEFISLLHVLHEKNIVGHGYRGYKILDSINKSEVSSKIMNYNAKRPVWFVFAGMGTQWSGMGRDLLKIEVCKRSLQRCANVLKPHGVDLIDIITNNKGNDNAINTTVAIVAIEIALVDMLTSIRVHPDGIIGHSLGEFCCGYVNGALTLEQAISLVYHRGKVITETKLESGAMAAVGLNWEKAEKICPSDINIACHNSPEMVTISGPSKSVLIFTEELQKKDIFVKMVNSNGIAFHSKYMKPIESKLHVSFKEIIPNPKPRSNKWISTSVLEAAWDTPSAQYCSAEYYINSTLSCVFFQEGITHIPNNAITIEIAPHGLLQSILCRSLPATVTNISLQQRNNSDNIAFLLSNLGKLYIAGAQPDVSKLYLPVNYPVSRGTPMIGSLIKWDHSVEWTVPSFDTKQNTSEHVLKIDLSHEAHAYLTGHKIDGKIIFPGPEYMMFIWRTFANLCNVDYEQFPVVFEDVYFLRATILPKDGTVKFTMNLFEKTGIYEFYEGDAIVTRGRVRALTLAEKNQMKTPSLIMLSTNKTFLPLSHNDVYKEMTLRGYEFQGNYKGIISSDNYGTVGKLRWFNWSSYIDNMFQFGMICRNRTLAYGTNIQYLAIDPIRHKQLVSKLSETDGLPVYCYKNANMLKSGGIEARGVITTEAQRLLVQPNLNYERYVFVPYENPCNIAGDPSTGTMHSLTILLQIIYENAAAFQVNVVELAGGRSAETLMAQHVLNIFERTPLITVKLQLIAASANNYKEYFKQLDLNVDVIISNMKDTSITNNVHVIVAANILTNQSYDLLENLVNAIKPGCFILLEESTTLFDLRAALKTDLVLIAQQTNSAGKTYLLLKKQDVKRERIIIHVTEKTFLWLDDLKAALRKSDSNGNEVLLVCQGEESFGMVGFMTCIRLEPGGRNARYVFIQDKNAPPFDPTEEFYANQLGKGLMANVLKTGRWGSYRHLQINQHSNLWTEHAYINILKKKNLNTLSWFQSPLKEQWSNIPVKTTKCSVYYAAINTRDSMLMTGTLISNVLPGKMKIEDPVLGLEFSGRDTNGRRVMGVVKAGGLATTVLANSDFTWEVPDKWTLEEAATIPLAYAISYYALFVRDQLKISDSILIDVGVDGIGQAAIALALHIGCTVFVTVSTPNKMEYIKKMFPQLPDKYIGMSRDITFEQFILLETHERGVNVVLASTEEELEASPRCLAVNGRFLGIGNYKMSRNCSWRNVTFHNIRFETLLFEECTEKKEVTRLVSKGIQSGAVQPLSSVMFTEQQIEEAFKFLLDGEYIGKTLLKIRDEEPDKCVPPTPKLVTAVPRTYMNSRKSYIIIGGLGGFGLELADWMIARGAKFIVLVSSSGIRTGYQALCVRRWSEAGINVVISTEDVATLSGAEQLIKESNQLAAVGGIFNVAATFRDGLIENLQEEDFKVVMSPKIDGTRNLGKISDKLCPSLDYFVVFSSGSCGRGSVAQCNYGLANSAVERMIEQRRAAGLLGLAIQWGTIGDTGMYIDNVGDNDTPMIGIQPQRMSSCLTTIDFFLQQPYDVLCSTVVAEKEKLTSDSKPDLVKTVANFFSIKDINLINSDDKLTSLGMDSLGAVELRYIFERRHGIFLSSQEILSLTIAKLKDLAGSIAGNS